MSSSRELRTGLGADVLDVGAPPSLVLGPGWAARPVPIDGADLELVHRWMNNKHVALRWEQAWSRERWSAAVAEQLSSAHSRPWIVAQQHEGQSRDVAYIEVYRPARDVVAGHYDVDPNDLGVHIAIGDEALTGQGLGTAVVREVCDALLAADPACVRVLADPEAGHGAARAMFARAGFALLGEVELAHKRAALMVRSRP